MAAALLRHGSQSLPELRRSSGLPAAQVRAALLVLVQHNLAAAWLHVEPPSLRGGVVQEQQYEALPGAMLTALHAPRFLLLIKDTMGDTAEAIAFQLLHHGRLR